MCIKFWLFSGTAIFLLYVTGMMGLMIAITLLVAFSASILNKMKILSKYVEKIGGILLVVAGLFIPYYAFS